MWLGQWTNNEQTPFGLKWPKEPILSLGIFLSCNRTIKLNISIWRIYFRVVVILKKKADVLVLTLSHTTAWKRIKGLNFFRPPLKYNSIKHFKLRNILYFREWVILTTIQSKCDFLVKLPADIIDTYSNPFFYQPVDQQLVKTKSSKIAEVLALTLSHTDVWKLFYLSHFLFKTIYFLPLQSPLNEKNIDTSVICMVRWCVFSEVSKEPRTCHRSEILSWYISLRLLNKFGAVIVLVVVFIFFIIMPREWQLMLSVDFFYEK